jgi:hypothetical protein
MFPVASSIFNLDINPNVKGGNLDPQEFFFGFSGKQIISTFFVQTLMTQILSMADQKKYLDTLYAL